MLPFLTESFGNPSSAHAFGRTARAALDEAHERVATRLHAEPREIVFTSGGTEANNLALKGAAWAGKAHGHRIVTSAVEHHAVGHTLRHLEKFGFEIVELPVDRYGRVDPGPARGGAHGPHDPGLDHARQQRGRHDPADRRDRQGRPRRARACCSMSMPSRRRRTSISTWAPSDADLVSLGAHKFEGPKGVGALYVRHGTHILAQQQGGTQERHRRAGTENVAGAVGLAAAYDLSCSERSETVGRLRRQRERLRQGDPGHARHGDDRSSQAAAARPPLDHRARHGRRVGVDVARPRGHRLLGRLGVYDRLDRGQSRADRDGLPGGGGPRRAAPVARTDDDRRRDRRRLRGRAAGHRVDARRGEPLSPATRSGRRSAYEPHPRRDVGRGRLVRRRGARAGAGPRRRRRLDAPARRRRHATPSSRRAAARSTPPTTPAASPRSSTSRSTS